MHTIVKSITFTTIIFITMIFFSLFIKLQAPINATNNSNPEINIAQDLTPFKLKDNEITFIDDTKINNISKLPSGDILDKTNSTRVDILSKAKAMTEIKWTPKHNMIDNKGHYTFVKGKTYTGIPYSMGPYQANSANDFLSKINSSNKILGNDCSGFVSAAWDISRQTTLSLFNSIKDGNKIDGKSVCKISWNDLEPGDALLLENGKGKGHILLYIDGKNNDSLHVYEQNIGTIMPFEPIPVAREDIRSKKILESEGYFPIRIYE